MFIYKNKNKNKKSSVKECVIIGGKFNKENVILAKNRDRTYKPTVSIVQKEIDLVQVTYLYDHLTGWLEGMNEFGIGVVNSALLVDHDEKEAKYAKSTGMKSEDAPRILKALSYSSIKDAVNSVAYWDGGIKGHTIVANKHRIYHVECTGRHEPVITEIKDHIVFTNHGYNYQDIGYQMGEKYLSSKIRKSVIEDSLDGSEIAETILDKLYNQTNENDFFNPVRNSNGMFTTCQIAMDLFDLKFYFRPTDMVKFEGVNNKLENSEDAVIEVVILDKYEPKELEDNGK